MNLPRKSGILLHPTSLPSSKGIGTLGKSAYDFVDFLNESKVSLWQVLPLGPTGFGDSPYQCFSAFALNPLLIDFDLLVEKGWALQEDVECPDEISENGNIEYGKVIFWKNKVFAKIAEKIKKLGGKKFENEFNSFLKENDFWLEDYSLFMNIKSYYDKDGQWNKGWSEDLKNRDSEALKKWESSHKKEISTTKIIQFLVFLQWNELHEYAKSKNVKIIGDIPIFVSPDSADVWSNQKYFQLDEKCCPKVVAGVPPDYFSPTGQLWGNPLYDWKKLEENNFVWWILRIKQSLKLFDYLRIDHFRGFDSYWAVKADKKTAVDGKWIKGPGIKLFNEIKKQLGELPLIAEDLGEITDSVRKLRDKANLPGMKILQFAFDTNEYSNEKLVNAFLPHTFTTTNCVIYTGTHDNDTTQGFLNSLNNENIVLVASYLEGRKISWQEARNFSSSGELCRRLVAKCFESTASFAIVPLQDLFCFGSDCRMNTPGTNCANWSWRMRSDLLYGESASIAKAWLKEMNILYNR